MAIAKMKRLHLIALQSDRKTLMEKLLHMGCVHLSEPTEVPEELKLRRDTSQLSERQAALRQLRTALATLQRAAPRKGGGLLSPRPQVTEADFLDDELLAKQLQTAEQVNDHAGETERLQAKENRLRTERMTLLPWRELDLPLDKSGTRTVRTLTGTLPTAVDWDGLQGELADRVEEAQIHQVGESREQKCVLLLCHKDVLDAALEVLRSRGFAASQLGGLTGTVAENLQRLDAELDECEKNILTEKAALLALGGEQDALKQCIDRMELEVRREESRERLLTDEKIFYLDGWVPVKQEEKLAALLDSFDCAWTMNEPVPEEYENVPVKLENNCD